MVIRREMKRIRKALVLALAFAVISPVAANAKTTVMGGPYTNLKSNGQIVHLALSGYPPTSGLYVQQCLQSADTSRPSLCNQAAQLWISTSQGASFAPNADIQFKPTASFTSGTTAVDCTKSVCGIFIRLDHTAPTDFSEDQFIPITFAADATPALPADVITATVNDKALSSAQPLAVNYRDVFKVVATTKSGVAVTYASLAPACAINGNEVTVLKGTGYCDIAVNSVGNAQYSGVTAHFPLQLNVGIQTVSVASSAKSGTKLNLPATSNFGEKVTYSVSKSANCSLTGNVLSIKKKGACVIKASAPALTDTYAALKQTITVKIK
jgi:hypothetical protein